MPAHSEQRLPQSDKWLAHQAPRPPPGCSAGGTASWPSGWAGDRSAPGCRGYPRYERSAALAPASWKPGAERAPGAGAVSAQARSFRPHTARRKGRPPRSAELARARACRVPGHGKRAVPFALGGAQRNSVGSMASAMARSRRHSGGADPRRRSPATGQAINLSTCLSISEGGWCRRAGWSPVDRALTLRSVSRAGSGRPDRERQTGSHAEDRLPGSAAEAAWTLRHVQNIEVRTAEHHTGDLLDWAWRRSRGARRAGPRSRAGSSGRCATRTRRGVPVPRSQGRAGSAGLR